MPYYKRQRAAEDGGLSGGMGILDARLVRIQPTPIGFLAGRPKSGDFGYEISVTGTCPWIRPRSPRYIGHGWPQRKTLMPSS